jgi:hypothetical protein
MLISPLPEHDLIASVSLASEAIPVSTKICLSSAIEREEESCESLASTGFG